MLINKKVDKHLNLNNNYNMRKNTLSVNRNKKGHSVEAVFKLAYPKFNYGQAKEQQSFLNLAMDS